MFFAVDAAAPMVRRGPVAAAMSPACVYVCIYIYIYIYIIIIVIYIRRRRNVTTMESVSWHALVRHGRDAQAEDEAVEERVELLIAFTDTSIYDCILHSYNIMCIAVYIYIYIYI